jgi:hypothetical protein
MKVTTIRFGADLWALLESEAARSGVSVSQYLREAALTRAAAAAAARGEQPFELLAGLSPAVEEKQGAQERPAEGPGELARRTAAEQRGDAHALAAQSKQARRHAGAVGAESEQALRRARAASADSEEAVNRARRRTKATHRD